MAGCLADNSLLTGTVDGSLYVFSLSNREMAPALVGRHQGDDVSLIERSTDGVHALSAGPAETCGWDVAAAKCFWRRHDLCVSSAEFQPSSTRVLCGLTD